MSLLDRCAHENRWTRRHPAEKVGLAAIGLLAAFLLPPVQNIVLLTLLLTVAVHSAQLPLTTLFRVLIAPFFFIALGAALLMVSLDPFQSGLRMTWVGTMWPVSARVMTRAWTAAACLVVLALTTPASDLVALLHRLHAPAPMTALMATTYRQLFLLIERFDGLVQAQHLRLGYSHRRAILRSSGYLGAQLFHDTLAQSRRLAIGWAVRGYEGHEPFPAMPYMPPSMTRGLLALVLCGLLWGTTW